MTQVVYRIVPHEDGWAYTSDGVYSETFRSKEAALDAAKMAASEQQVPGETGEIQYEEENGKWKSEHVDGHDRPEAIVVE